MTRSDFIKMLDDLFEGYNQVLVCFDRKIELVYNGDCADYPYSAKVHAGKTGRINLGEITFADADEILDLINYWDYKLVK